MTARCACGRWLGNVRATCRYHPDSYDGAYSVGDVTGDCSRCGPRQTAPAGLSWEEAFGDWEGPR